MVSICNIAQHKKTIFNSHIIKLANSIKPPNLTKCKNNFVYNIQSHFSKKESLQVITTFNQQLSIASSWPCSHFKCKESIQENIMMQNIQFLKICQVLLFLIKINLFYMYMYKVMKKSPRDPRNFCDCMVRYYQNKYSI